MKCVGDHGPWWHYLVAHDFRIGDAEYVSFLVCQRVPIKVVQQEPSVEEQQFLSLECA